MMKDMIIIGGGPAGNAAALAARSAGVRSVVLVERDAMGGTCTNRGCIPTKLLLARSRHFTREGDGDGPAPGEWARTLTYKRGLVRGLSRSIGERCRQAGVEIVSGTGRLAGGMRVEVETVDGAVEEYEGRRIVLAAGSAPAVIPGATVDGKAIITSDEALELEEPPASLVVIGSGAVGSELACLFNRLGTRVTMVEAAERLFPHEDAGVGEIFGVHWERAGVEVVTGDPVERVEAGPGGAEVVLHSCRRIAAERVLVAVGRRLLGAGLRCELAGVELGPGGEVVVDAELRTTAEGVYAAGDVTGRMLLAHVATAEGEAAALAASGRAKPGIRYDAIPWATFTTPEVASVGLGADVAAARGIEVAAGSARFMDNVKSRIDRATEGFVKVVAERGTGRIIGATIVGAHASEMIHSLGVAIDSGLSASRLRRFVYLHPCASETITDALDDLISNIKQ